MCPSPTRWSVRGPIDLIYVPGFINNLEVVWDNTLYA
jgi:hypothetical protein